MTTFKESEVSQATQAVKKESLQKFDIFFRFLAVAMLAATIGIAVVIYALYHPTTPVVIKSTTITTPVVPSTGGIVRYDYVYCKYTDKSPTVFREIVPQNKNLDTVTFSSVLGITIRGCHTAHLTLPLLPNTAPGVYHVHGHLVYQLNSYRTTTVDYNTGNFTVVK